MTEKQPGVKPPTKAEVYANIAQATGLTKKQVADVMDALGIEIGKCLSKTGPGQFNMLGLLKIVRIHKAATERRQVRKPGTNEMVWADAKPERYVVKVRPLKQLKDLVG